MNIQEYSKTFTEQPKHAQIFEITEICPAVAGSRSSVVIVSDLEALKGYLISSIRKELTPLDENYLAELWAGKASKFVCYNANTRFVVRNPQQPIIA